MNKTFVELDAAAAAARGWRVAGICRGRRLEADDAADARGARDARADGAAEGGCLDLAMMALSQNGYGHVYIYICGTYNDMIPSFADSIIRYTNIYIYIVRETQTCIYICI